MPAETKRYPGIIVFNPNIREQRYTMPDPDSEALSESLHRLRYNLAAATQSDAYRVLFAAEAYLHFATHPTSTKNMIRKLRALRRAVREGDSQ